MIVIPQNDELEIKLAEDIDKKVTLNIVQIDTANSNKEEAVFQNNEVDEEVVYEKEKTDIRNI